MQKKNLEAAAFFHSEGLVPALKLAKAFGGKNGTVATLPDIIQARLHTQPGSVPWERYFTTTSAEYFGRSRNDSRIIIVAHGIGPMATLDGMINAYSHQFKDQTRRTCGGRITQQEFLDLEAGKYGEVEVVDLDAYLKRYQYPFIEPITCLQAMEDPLVQARFGKKADMFVTLSARFAREWHAQQGHEYVDDPYILTVGENSNCAYQYAKNDGRAIAHLLSCGQLSQARYPDHYSLVHDVQCHGWNDGTRFVGIRSGAALTDIVDVDVHQILRQQWESLLQNVPTHVERKFFVLMQLKKGIWFTQYEKKGECMDTCEPEFPVTSLKPIGQPIDFTTTIGGYHGLLKYGIREVLTLAPRGANAYALAGEPVIVGEYTHHRVPVQFYRATVDTTRRLPEYRTLESDYDTIIRLLA